MASTTALPPPTSIEQGKVPATLSAGCCYKACAGHFICRLLLLRGLCRPLRLPAVFTARPVPVGSSAGCFYYEACAGQLHQRPCFALQCLACLPLPWPHACCLVSFAPVHYRVRQDHRASCRDCPVGSRNTGLHWRPVHRFFLFPVVFHAPETACEQPGSLLEEWPVGWHIAAGLG